MASLASWRNQAPFNRILGDQAHRPTTLASRRFTADHGDDPLLLAIVEQSGLAGALDVVEGPLQSALLKAVANFPDCLRGQRDETSNLRSAAALRRLQQGESPQDGSDGLHTTAEMSLQVLVVFKGEPDL